MKFRQILKYCLSLILIFFGCFAIYAAIPIYAPCVYPMGDEANEVEYIANKVKSFQLRHRRLPRIENSNELTELGLDFEIARKFHAADEKHFEVFSQKVGPASQTQMGFDGPWAIYKSKTNAITCGIR